MDKIYEFIAKKGKIIILFSVIILMVITSIYTYLKFNPPLIFSGGIYHSNYKNGAKINIIDIENKGRFDITIKKVYTDESLNPEKVELGVSKSLRLVAGHMYNSELVTFYEIDKYKIMKRLNSLEIDKIVGNENNTTIYYGIKIYDDKLFNKVFIEYKYFGIKFILEIKV